MVPLNFLGVGSAFNARIGNTSAFFIEDKKLFLIDCGRTVMDELKKVVPLQSIEAVYVVLTHTHNDHIGSLASLVEHTYWELHIPMYIIVPRKLSLIALLIRMNLASSLCGHLYYGHWNLMSAKKASKIFNSFDTLKMVKTPHVKFAPCYSLIFDCGDSICYYSGDTSSIEALLKQYRSGKKIEHAYIECCEMDIKNSPHMNIVKLYAAMPEEIRQVTTCMHFDNNRCIAKAAELGFKLPPIPITKKDAF